MVALQARVSGWRVEDSRCCVAIAAELGFQVMGGVELGVVATTFRAKGLRFRAYKSATRGVTLAYTGKSRRTGSL